VAKKSMIAKAKRTAEVRRAPAQPLQPLWPPAGYYRQFGMCRVCVREMASRGELPGVRKASW
jgi:small subunit ribosomal protein S14